MAGAVILPHIFATLANTPPTPMQFLDDNFNALNNALGALSTGIAPPGGRLTLTSQTPVLTADVTGASHIYYDSFNGFSVPIWNGTTWISYPIPGNEISMGLAAANFVSGSNYDIFCVVVSGGLAIGIGPAWAGQFTRGSGGGSTQISITNGFWANTNALATLFGGPLGTTNLGPIAAGQATYLGSAVATGSGTTQMNVTRQASTGGTNPSIGLYNAYNRVPMSVGSSDATANWTYSTATWRSANNSNLNRVNWIDGLGNLGVQADYIIQAGNSSGTGGENIGIDYNNNTSTPGQLQGAAGGLNAVQLTAMVTQGGGLGYNFFQAMEYTVSGTATFVSGSVNSILLLTGNF